MILNSSGRELAMVGNLSWLYDEKFTHKVRTTKAGLRCRSVVSLESCARKLKENLLISDNNHNHNLASTRQNLSSGLP